jgi:integrase
MSSVSAPSPSPGDWDYRSFAPVPFAEFVDEILALYEFPLRAKATRDKLRQVLGIVADLLGPGGTTAGLDPSLVARLIASRPPAESPHTTQGLLNSLRAACSYAKSRGYLRSSPFDYRTRWIRVGKPTRKKHHPLADIRRVLDLLADEVDASTGWARWRARRLLALASVVAYTGMRRDEALNLRVEDVDLDGRMIAIVERSQRLKTTGSAQPVPIPDALAPILAGWMARRMDEPERGFPSPPDCPFLFCNVTRTNAWKFGSPGTRPLDQLKEAGERAGVEGFTFLSLRHSWATHAESWGLSATMIQRVLRHTTTRTQGHYRHADAPNMRAAVGGIDFGATTPGGVS